MSNSSFIFRRSLLVSAMTCVLMTQVHASTVRDDIDYQVFRDFAENKGAFSVGATDVQIKDKSGKVLGTVLPKGIAMPDFSVANIETGVATVIDPQYVASAMHNTSNIFSQSLKFGHHLGYDYKIAARNDANDLTEDQIVKMQAAELNDKYNDFSAHRLNKLVTEVAPTNYYQDKTKTASEFDQNNYSAFARLGSGTQNTSDTLGNTKSVEGAYRFLTGGTPPTITGLKEIKNASIDPSSQGYYIRTTEVVYADTHDSNKSYSPLVSITEKGDSGSGLYGFNKKTQKWELVGVVNGVTTLTDPVTNKETMFNTYTLVDRFTLDKGKVKYTGASIALNDKVLNAVQWKNDNAALNQTVLTDINRNNVTLEKSKDLYLNKDLTISLTDNIDQGSGAIFVGQNVPTLVANAMQSRVIVENQPNGRYTWQGAGIDIAKGSELVWRVSNPEKDRLSKVGQGTLTVNGTGKNLGDISVGDGLVMLNQQADSTGKQAFNSVEIVSGRGTVQLGSKDQIDLNNVKFGYRGGRLDLNGLQGLEANYIANIDQGAQIVNHAGNKASLTLLGKKQINSNGVSYYDLKNGGYYRLRSVNTTVKPLVFGQSNLDWAYLGNTLGDNSLSKEYDRQVNAQNLTTTFAGFLGENDPSKNGQLDITYKPTDRASESTLMLTGGSNLNGNLSAEAGTLLLSGLPTSHAIDYARYEEIVKDNDWINRNFTATTIKANNNAKVIVGRNVGQVNANFDIANTASAKLGYINGQTPVCVRSEYNFEHNCSTTPFYAADVLSTIPTTQIKGNVKLSDQAHLALGKAQLTGQITAGANTQVNMASNARWTMTNDSTLGQLSLTDGAQVILNSAADAKAATQYNTLHILGNLTGNGQFNYMTNLSQFQGDKVVVDGVATGNYKLYVQDTGKEVAKTKQHLALMTLNNANQGTQAVVKLANTNEEVDLGAYRYSLIKEGNDYRLYSPLLEKAINTGEIDKLAAEAAAKAAAEKAAAEAAAKAAAEKAAAEAAAKAAAEKAVAEAAAKAAAEKAVAEAAEAAAAKAAAEKAAAEVAAKAAAEKAAALNQAMTAAAQAKTAAAQAKTAASAAASAAATARATNETVTAAQASLEAENAAKAAQAAQTAAQIAQTAVEELKNATGTNVAQALAKVQAATQTATQAAESAKKATDLALAAQNKALADAKAKLLASQQAPTQASGISRFTNTALSEVASQVSTLQHINRGLTRQILSDDARNVWMTADRIKETAGSTQHRPYDKSETLTQVGANHQFTSANGSMTVGGVYSHSTANTDFADHMNGKNDLDMLSLYGKYKLANQAFVAIDAGYGRAKNEIDSSGEKTGFNRNLATVGVNVGKTFATPIVDIQPSVGVRYDHLAGQSYNLNQAKVKVEDTNLVSYRAGVKLSKDITLPAGVRIVPAVAADFVDNTHSDANLVMNDTYRFTQNFGRHSYTEASLGVTYKKWGVSMNAAQSQGKNVSKQQSAGLKVAYQW
ncbi:S6 family peptidase [Acinetobacter sp. c3-l95]|uniref:S6 family peptidase n=1 Tax=Acinetobacter sp. c3-l95 TaxID=3342804 RepID=UPI0035B91E89